MITNTVPYLYVVISYDNIIVVLVIEGHDTQAFMDKTG